MMGTSAASLILRLCLAIVRVCSRVVPRAHRHEWRQEWEGELLHRREAMEARGRFDARQQLNLLRRATGAFPDAAWCRRQFTADAELLQDVRHAVRMLLKSPIFAGWTIAILAVGIGATVGIVTLLDTLMFRALPYAATDRVMTIWQRGTTRAGDMDDVAPANFLDWRARATSFSAMAGVVPYSYDYTGGGNPEVFFGAQVTEGFWEAVGVRPQLGRPFLPEEHVPGGRPVAIISHGAWQRRFGADPAILNRAIDLDGAPFTVVGVLPQDFDPQLLPRPAALDVWTPKILLDHERRTRGSAWWNVVARLKPGVSEAQAQEEMDRISAALAREYPSTNAQVTAAVIPLRDHLMGEVRTPLLAMLGAAVLVLGIGCANVASLLLARGRQREHEFAIRTALGAGRGRLVRQLVTESLLLSSVAAIAGVAFAHWAIGVIIALAPPGAVRLQSAAIDARTLAFAAGLAVAATVAFGLVPALQFSRPAHHPTRERQASGPRRAFRRGLVATELALALVLLTGAGLLVKSFNRLMSVDPGFAPNHVVELQVFIQDRHPGAEKTRAFIDLTLDRIRSIRGVHAAGAVSAMPFASANIDIKSPLEVVGRPLAAAADRPGAFVTVATDGYFEAMAIRLRSGRLIGRRDTEQAAPVAVISDALQRREWPNQDPIGGRIAVQWHGRRIEAEIVGVVSQIRHDSLDSAPRAEVFLPFAQAPFGSMTYVVRAAGEPSAVIAAVKQQVWSVDPLQTFYDSASVEALVNASAVRQRFSTSVMSAFAVLAVVLCATGLYGVISFTTAQRTREIGVRMALGATEAAIRRMVLREGGIVIAAGVAAGLAAALASMRMVRTLLFEVEPGDPLTMLSVTIIITGVGLAACYIPARRATKVDPITALRID